MITRQFNIVLNTKVLKTLSSNMVVTQNDKDVNLLKIRVFNGDEEINYSQISRGEIFFEKRDKNVVQGDLEKVTDGFTYQMGTNEIACTGEVLAIIHLYGSSGERLSTSKFKFTVERDLENENAIKSSSQYAALQKIIVDFNEAFSDIINGISEEIPEIIQARHDSVRNKTFNNLRERLDQDSFDIDTNANRIGNLSEMTTTEKTNLSGAVSEVKNELTSHKEESANKAHGGIDYSQFYLNSSMSIPNATITTVPFSNIDKEGSILFSPDGKFTIPQNIKVIGIESAIVWGYDSTGVRQAGIMINGAMTGNTPKLRVWRDLISVEGFDVDNSNVSYPSQNIVKNNISVSEGDTIEVYVYQNSGKSLNIFSSSSVGRPYIKISVVE